MKIKRKLACTIRFTAPDTRNFLRRISRCRLFMAVAQFFYTIGFLFALYLLGMSYFVIGALCPWCLLVTLTTTLVWFAITRYNILENNLYLSKDWHKKLTSFVKNGYDTLIMWSFVVLVAAAIIIKYGQDLFA